MRTTGIGMIVVGLAVWVVALALPGYDLGLLLFQRGARRVGDVRAVD